MLIDDCQTVCSIWNGNLNLAQLITEIEKKCLSFGITCANKVSVIQGSNSLQLVVITGMLDVDLVGISIKHFFCVIFRNMDAGVKVNILPLLIHSA